MQPKGGLAFMLVVGGAIKIAHFAIVFGLRLDDVICLPKTVGDFSATTSDKDNTASDVRSIFVDFDLTPHHRSRSPKCSLNRHRAKLSGIFFDICIYRGPQKYNQQIRHTHLARSRHISIRKVWPQFCANTRRAFKGRNGVELVTHRTATGKQKDAEHSERVQVCTDVSTFLSLQRYSSQAMCAFSHLIFRDKGMLCRIDAASQQSANKYAREG